jgi:hypothetical protein
MLPQDQVLDLHEVSLELSPGPQLCGMAQDDLASYICQKINNHIYI